MALKYLLNLTQFCIRYASELLDTPLHILGQNNFTGFKALLNLDDTLVITASEAEFEVLAGFDELAVDEDIGHLKHRKSVFRVASLIIRIEKLLEKIAGIGPDSLVRIFSSDPFDERTEDLLVYDLPRLATEYGYALNVWTGKGFDDLFSYFRCEELSVVEIPGSFIEAAFAVMGTAGYV